MNLVGAFSRLIDRDIILTFNRIGEAHKETSIRKRALLMAFAIYGPRVSWIKIAVLVFGPLCIYAVLIPKPPSEQAQVWFVSIMLVWIFAFFGYYFYRYKIIGRQWRLDPTAKLTLEDRRG